MKKSYSIKKYYFSDTLVKIFQRSFGTSENLSLIFYLVVKILETQTQVVA